MTGDEAQTITLPMAKFEKMSELKVIIEVLIKLFKKF